LSTLYTPRKPANRNRKERTRRRHHTVPELTILLVRLLLRWAPERRFVLVGDATYASHDLAKAFGPQSQHKALRRVRLVSRFPHDAAIYDEPGEYGGRGRPRIKGRKLPNPRAMAEHAAPEQWHSTALQWYAGKQKVMMLLSNTALWYRPAQGAKRVRWIVVRDPEGNHRDEVFFTTDENLSPGEIVETFIWRWSLETTFQESRELLGLETLRNWSPEAINRSVPLLLGLYSVIVAWFARCVDSPESYCIQSPWYKRGHVTFSDMLTAARLDVLPDIINQRSEIAQAGQKVGALILFPAMTHRLAKCRAA